MREAQYLWGSFGTRSGALTTRHDVSPSPLNAAAKVESPTAGEAQAMIALLDRPGALDGSGRTIYSYAHPLFWAPYSVIGDGGGT